MATRFELLLAGRPDTALRAAGEEALSLIHRLESQLSCYRPQSEIGRINALAAERPVRVDGEVFSLLLRARALHHQTGGAFDITVGPLMRCWGLNGRDCGRIPTEPELQEARDRVGMHRLELDEARGTVRFERDGMAIDLGAIGKGYALELAAARLRELGVASALLHGGTSSVQAIGESPEGCAWRVAIEHPYAAASRTEDRVLSIVDLRDQALGVSAGHGKQFHAGDTWYGHVLDPRAGRPARAAQLAAVVCDSGTDADALSTGLLVLGAAGMARLPRTRTLVVEGDVSTPRRVHARGFTLSRTLHPQHV